MNNSLEDIRNYLKLSDRFATAGQPSPEQFATIREGDYTKIINLAMPTSTNALPNEKELVEAQGMEYIPIPVVWEQPTLADFQKFVDTINSSPNQKIFVHCALNMRVSAFMYLYRRVYESISHEVAIKDLHQLWTPNPVWQKFIDEVINHHSGS